MDDYADTNYIKPSSRTAPPKADHRHEYVRPFAMMRVRLGESITAERRKISLPPRCIDCGHVRRRNTGSFAEVEVTPDEYRRLKGI